LVGLPWDALHMAGLGPIVPISSAKRGSSTVVTPRDKPPDEVTKTFRTPEALFLAGVATVGVTDWRLKGNVTPSDALFLLALILSRVRRLGHRRSPKVGAGLPLALLVGPGMAIGALHGDTVGWSIGVRAIISVLLPFAALRDLMSSRSDDSRSRRFLRGIFVAYECGAIVWLALTLLGVGVEEVLTRGRSGPTDHVTSAGILLSTCFLISVGRLFTEPRAILSLLSLVSASVGLVLNGSRSSALVLFPVAWILGRSMWKTSGVVARRLFVVGFVALFFLVSGKARLSLTDNVLVRRFTNVDRYVSESNAERVAALRNGWMEFLSHPFLGVGFSGSRLAHSVPLQILRTSGLIGGFGLALLLRRCNAAAASLARHAAFPFGVILTGVFMLVSINTQAWDRFIWVLPLSVLAACPSSTPTRDSKEATRASPI
jgi:hypothetical protein